MWAQNPNLSERDGPPPDYLLFVAARLVGRPPWELVDVPLWWLNRVIAMDEVMRVREAAERAAAKGAR